MLAPAGGWETSVTGKRIAIVSAVWSGAFVLLSGRHWLLSLALCPLIAFVAFLVMRLAVGTSPNFSGITSFQTKGHPVLRRLLAPVVAPGDAPRFQFVTHPIGHYAEGLRWCMDLTDVPYRESNVVALIPALLRGRTIPWLVDCATSSLITNSEEARMFVAAVHVPTMKGDAQCFAKRFFERTPEALEWEPLLAKLGHAVQGFCYYYLLGAGSDCRGYGEFHLQFWGIDEPLVPAVDRQLLRLLYPLVKLLMRKATMGLEDPSLVVERREAIREVLSEVDKALAASSGPHLLGGHLSYVDIIFCALAGPLMAPKTMLAGAGGKVKWANNRFASFARIDPKAVGKWPDELVEFEKEMAARPSGKYVLDIYSRWRGGRASKA